MKAYVIILNYNSWQDTIESASSVINSSWREYQIIILDNNSPNNSQKMISKWLDGDYKLNHLNVVGEEKSVAATDGSFPYVVYDEGRLVKRDLSLERKALETYERENGKSPINSPVLFIQTGENLGFAGGNNVALKCLQDSAEEAFVFLLNPDVVLKLDALAQLHSSFEPMQRELFVSGIAIMDYQQPDKKLSAGGVKIFKPIGLIRPVIDEHQSVDYIYGGALFTNTYTLRQVGLLPEEYFLYWEETDWCTKAKRMGVPFYLFQKAVCYDKVGTSIGRGFVSEYFFTRNAFYFYKKYFPFFLTSLFLFQIVRLFIKFAKLRFDLAKGIIAGLTDVIRERKRNVIK